MPNSNVYVDTSPIHGKGLFAGALIPAGTEIGTLVGEYTTDDGDYVLWLDGTKGILVDCDLRYINHSDSPNAVYYDDLTVWALKDIHPGEEITHDYNQLDCAGENPDGKDDVVQAEVRYRQHWLPWLLLSFSWLGMGIYLVVSGKVL